MAGGEIAEAPAVDSKQYLPSQGDVHVAPSRMKSDTLQSLLPVIDMALPREDLVKAVGKALEAGFFQIINHGTDLNLLKRVVNQAEEFFTLPEERIVDGKGKRVIRPDQVRGGILGEWRDCLKISHLIDMDCWPDRPHGFRETLKEYFDEQQPLVRRLLAIISESLGLESDYIDKDCGDATTHLGLNHCPPCPDPSLTLGFRAHSDPNTLTLLVQTQVAGLQVFKDGLWFDVKPLEGAPNPALIVNAGFHLEILSNGKYRSYVHRVTNNKTNSRTSFALLFSPARIAHIKPAPALVDEKHPAKFREFVYPDLKYEIFNAEFFNNKLIQSKFETPEP